MFSAPFPYLFSRNLQLLDSVLPTVELLFPISQSITTHPLQLLFMDVWGPKPQLSCDGFRFYFSIVDAYMRYTWLFPIRCKSDVYTQFLTFHKTFEYFFNLQILNVQTDWGGDFRALHNFLRDHGISHRISRPHTHQKLRLLNVNTGTS